MKSELSSVEVGIIARELNELSGSRLDSVYQLGDKDVVVQLYKAGLGKVKVRLMAPKAAFVTSGSFDFPEVPPRLCSELRKHLDGSRFTGARQLLSERILELSFSSRDSSFRLVAELFSKGNIVLCGDVILSVAERQLWSDRKVVPGSVYSFPAKKHDFYRVDAASLSGLLAASGRDSLVKCLAMDYGLGGVYAEEVCALASVDKLKAPCAVSGEEIGRIIESVSQLLGRSLEPGIVYESGMALNVVPFRMRIYEGLEFRNFGSFSSALDFYFSSVKLSAHDRKLAELSRILGEQEAMLLQVRSEIGENTAKAEAVYQNYGLVLEVINEVRNARERLSWKEIKSRLKAHHVVKDVDEAKGTVIVEV
ncbi:NFACT family protein [Candidatus Woesearchaeota archaeon]|nr:NFACT family protein [Candidatus Woesearchaeota archaeon]